MREDTRVESGMDLEIGEIHWVRQGLDRYMLLYKDDRVAYCQVPKDDWYLTELINKQGMMVHEITIEDEIDVSRSDKFSSASDNSAAIFTQYGVPLIGVGVVWFIVWTMNRFKGKGWSVHTTFTTCKPAALTRLTRLF